MKNLIIITTILLSVANYSIAQRDLIISGENHYIDLPDEPDFEGNFAYLWWFGDGGYRITTKDRTAYSYQFSNPNMRASLSNEYVTTLITTENYGSEGNPDLIQLPNTFSLLPQTNVGIQKYLDPTNPTDFIRVTNFRNAVPGDTLYILLTYGLPYVMDTLQITDKFLSLSFSEDMDQFEYLDFGDHAETFLPHFENYLPYNGNEHIWTLPSIMSPGLLAGRERTILLPFRYNGEKNEGSLKINVEFKYHYSNFAGTVFGNAVQSGEAPLKFAKSHDPNSTQVSHDTVACRCGGKELEYEVKFENTGDKETNYVRVEMQMDKAHDLSTLELTSFPREFSSISEGTIFGYQRNYNKQEAFYEINESENRIIFEFHGLILMGLSDTLINDPARARDYIKFKVNLKEGNEIGDPINAKASIFFDRNLAVHTNEVETTCPNPIGDNKNSGNEGEKIDPQLDNQTNCFCWIITCIILFIIIVILCVWYLLKKRNQ